MNKKIVKFEVIIVILLCILRSSIYNFPGYVYEEFIKYILILLYVIFFTIVILNMKNLSPFSLVFAIIYFLDDEYKNNYVGTFVTMTLILFFQIRSNKIRIVFYKILYNFIYYICFFSIIEYLFYILGKYKIVSIIQVENKVQSGFYYVVGFFNSYLVNLSTNFELKRMLSIFNEPGSFGSLIGILLLFTDLRKNKMKNLIMILCGILTFSTAFFYFICLKIFIENIRNLKKMIICIILIIGLSFSIILAPEKYNSNMPQVYVHTVYKLKRITMKLIDGNGFRSTESDRNEIKKFYEKGNIILGNRKRGQFLDTYNIHLLIYEGGIIKLFFTIFIIIIISKIYKIKNKKVKILFFIGLTTIFQRPNLLEGINLMLFFSGPYYYYNLLNKKNINILLRS